LAANLILNGAPGAIVNQSNVNALTGLATIAPAGSLTLRSGRDFTASGSFQNQGTLTLEPGSIFNVANGYTQTATGKLNISLQGTNVGVNTGQLAIAQNAALGGTLG